MKKNRRKPKIEESLQKTDKCRCGRRIEKHLHSEYFSDEDKKLCDKCRQPTNKNITILLR